MKKIMALLAFALLFSCLVNAEITITEIMYNPDGSDTGKEWVELYNSGEDAVDMTGWKFREDDTNHGLNLYQGSFVVDGSGLLIIARNASKFLENYPEYTGNVVNSVFSLSNTGEELFVLDSGLNEMDFVNYTALAEEGYSMEVADASLDNSYTYNWIQGLFGGEPGNILKSESDDDSGNEIPEFGMTGALAAIGFAGLWIFLVRKRN